MQPYEPRWDVLTEDEVRSYASDEELLSAFSDSKDIERAVQIARALDAGEQIPDPDPQADPGVPLNRVMGPGPQNQVMIVNTACSNFAVPPVRAVVYRTLMLSKALCGIPSSTYGVMTGPLSVHGATLISEPAPKDLPAGWSGVSLSGFSIITS